MAIDGKDIILELILRSLAVKNPNMGAEEAIEIAKQEIEKYINKRAKNENWK